MARPTKYDRDAALDLAMHAIWKDGIDRSSVKRLSELLGMTRSSFYNAFGSQEDLVRECLPLYAAANPVAVLEDEVSGSVLVLITQVLKDLCRERAGDPEGRGCLIVNTVTELCPAKEGLGAEIAELILGSAHRLEELLDLAKANGEIAADADTRALALALQNAMVGLNVMCKVVGSEEELWLLTRATLQGLGLYRENIDA